MSAIATIGFGEAAQAFVAGWLSEDTFTCEPLSTFDIKVQEPPHREALLQACSRFGVLCAKSPGEALKGHDIVFSLVTANRAFEAAEQAAEFLERDALYLDCNSCSPATKAAAARLVEAAGAVYVDVAVMSPVQPARHRTPLLVSGPSVGRAQLVLDGLGMNARAAGDRVGQASSIKMLRSVMIKGLEALTAECILAARKAGVERDVLASLQASDPGIDWTARSAYNLERMMVHGKRRAAEMQEVAATLRELGLPDRMALATVDWQQQVGNFDIRTSETSMEGRAESILERFSN
ncbi:MULTISPECIES: DUF1932 domain-containing protein [unclassified Sinorhizobium]|uniref:NAD(P)-dependent oxidoreductase n=1 Tax=unclassified Sinorhizobium TaxID=2613772 RepID=UPI00352622F3